MCVSPDQATKYCGWLGGRLPRLTEWLYAARGTDVSRYAWGNTTPTCAQQARTTLAPTCCGVSCFSTEATSVGSHAAGQSPTGLSDVLLGGGAVIGADPLSPYAACLPPATACVATGIIAGAIDAFVPAPKPGNTTWEGGIPQYPNETAASFRCAWNGGSQ